MQQERTAQRKARGGVQQKGFFREIRIWRWLHIRLCMDSLQDFRAALLSLGRNKTLRTCSFPNRTNKLEPNKTPKQQNHNNKIPSLPSPLDFAYFFFFPHRYFACFLGVFFFFETSGLKILGHLGILGASDRSGAERREALGRPQRGEGCAGACAWEKGGTRGAKEATYIFRRRRKKKRNFKREKK